jgi:hypothetical protein
VKVTRRKIASLVAILVIAAHGFFGRFTYSSVCRHCGARQSTTEWQILFTSITLFRHSTFRETPFSVAADRYGRTKEQPHNWVFAAGGGNFILCAIGSGRYLWRSTGSPDVRRLLDLAFNSDRPFADALLTAALSPHSAQAVTELAATLPVSANTAEALASWRSEHAAQVNEALSPRKARNH